MHRTVWPRIARAVALALVTFGAAACAGGPMQVVPPTTEAMADGITHIRQTIPVADPTRLMLVDVYLPASPRPAPAVLVIPTSYMWAFRRAEQYDQYYAFQLAKQGFATMVPVVNSYPVPGGGYDARHADNMLAVSQWFRDRPEVMDCQSALNSFQVTASNSFHFVIPI